MAARTLVIEGGRLIDGNGGKPLDNATVVIENNRIKRVTSGPTGEIPQDATVIDACGKTLLPGLIDNHIHHRDLLGELFLAFGVTTVRDLGNHLEWILAQRDAVNDGRMAGPRIFCAGGGFYAKASAAHQQVPRDPAEAKQMVKAVIKRGVDYVKSHLHVSLEITQALAEETHAAAFKLLGHIDTSIIPYVEAGIDGVEHASGCAEATIRSAQGLAALASIKLWLAKFLACWTFAEREHYAEVIDLLTRKGTFIEPTMVLWGAPLGMREQWEREDYEILKSPGLSYVPENLRLQWLDHYYLAYGARAESAPTEDVVIGNRYSIYGIYPRSGLREGFERLHEFIAQLAKAGGNIVTGTDSGAVMPGISIHREMEFLVGAGLTPMQAIQAATKVGAQYLGQEKELGTIEAGKLADLIVLSGDPLKDIRQSRTVELVIKDGAVIDRAFHANFHNPIPRPTGIEFYGYPMPRLEKVSRQLAVESDADIELNLQGKDFFPASVVYFGSSPLPTKFLNQQELGAIIPRHMLRVGTTQLTVVNPRPHEFPNLGATSNGLPFMVRFARTDQAKA